uniref:Protein kinase domain-containing protein n=1 Tax=Brassica oleracea var. oleracea TaxID=109376 RepID=A0A0D3ATA2_BRAOL
MERRRLEAEAAAGFCSGRASLAVSLQWEGLCLGFLLLGPPALEFPFGPGPGCYKPQENWNKTSSVQLIAPTTSTKDDFSQKSGSSGGRNAEGLAHKPSGRAGGLIVPIDDSDGKTVIVERPTRSHRRCSTASVGTGGGFQLLQQPSNVISSVPHRAESELIAAGWPSWLTSVAGTYSTVYRARDLETGKMVAMKKVRFVNMDPESMRFMAREINILRKLDHPNVMKLECLVTSKLSSSLYLVFEYMEHDLSGLALDRTVLYKLRRTEYCKE